MIKFYTLLHTANNHFKKQFLFVSLVFLGTLAGSSAVYAQCIPAPVVNAVPNQVVCNKLLTTAIDFTGTATSYNWTNNNSTIGLSSSGTGNIASFTALNNSTVPVTAIILVTPVTGICSGTPVTFTITVNPSPAVTVTPITSCGGMPGGTGPCNPITASGADSYVWSPVTGLYTNCTSTIPYTGINVATVYASPIFYTRYTVTGTNAATGCSKSESAFVNYIALSPVVTPSPVFMCLNDPPVKVKVTPSQFCSVPVNIPVPDNNIAGASSNLLITGVPAPCTITNIAVTINMQHTRIGDMVFVLKAPNGQVINLDYRISATGNSNNSTGFVNTTISSTGTVALNAGTSPYTGTFRADAQLIAGLFGAPGPTGFMPTAANWSNLFISPNGIWTLAFYDGATGETGILNSWCLALNTSCGPISSNSTPAVWSPAVGLFSDPAATIPYIAGTAIDSVFVRPTPAGVYTYQVTSQGLPMPDISFTNPAAIIIPVGGAATAYPANVAVSGLPSTGVSIRSVVLNNFNHTSSNDVAIVLQSPAGQNIVLMAGVGGSNAANATYGFMDAAASSMSLTAANPAGTYKPTSNSVIHTFPAPGPGSILQSGQLIGSFTGNLNGNWKLFVIDEEGSADQGTISGGYTINFNIGATGCTSPATSFVVNVGSPVSVTTQPVNQTVCTDKVASFSVTAAGAALTYQWQVSTNGGATFSNVSNGGVYSGAATAVLTITAPALSMSGYRYKVIINGSASCSAAASTTAILTVNPLPVASIYAHPYSKLLPGLITTISSTVTPNAVASYTWLHDGLPVPGATADSILVDFDNIGLYQLLVIDVNGCTNLSDTMSIRDSLYGKIFVYPNQSSGKFQVRFYSKPNTVVPATLILYDNTGQILVNRPYNQINSYQRVDVDVRKHGKGLYWVEMLDAHGKRVGLSKLLIQ